MHFNCKGLTERCIVKDMSEDIVDTGKNGKHTCCRVHIISRVLTKNVSNNSRFDEILFACA